MLIPVRQVDESPTTGKITLGLSTIVRVSLKDGTFHEVCLNHGHPIFTAADRF